MIPSPTSKHLKNGGKSEIFDSVDAPPSGRLELSKKVHVYADASDLFTRFPYRLPDGFNFLSFSHYVCLNPALLTSLKQPHKQLSDYLNPFERHPCPYDAHLHPKDDNYLVKIHQLVEYDHPYQSQTLV